MRAAQSTGQNRQCGAVGSRGALSIRNTLALGGAWRDQPAGASAGNLLTAADAPTVEAHEVSRPCRPRGESGVLELRPGSGAIVDSLDEALPTAPMGGGGGSELLLL